MRSRVGSACCALRSHCVAAWLSPELQSSSPYFLPHGRVVWIDLEALLNGLEGKVVVTVQVVGLREIVERVAIARRVF